MKQIIKKIIARTRVLRPLKGLQQNKIIIFNYHRIKDRRRPHVPFDENVFGPDPIRFKEELTWLKDETRILNEDELIDVVYNGRQFNKICSMVTFDDGYRDNFDLAFPILKDLNIPAMFFIPTYHLSERKVGWWDIVAYLIKEFRKKNEVKDFFFHGQSYSGSDICGLKRKFINEIKSMESHLVEPYLEELSRCLNVPMPGDDLQDKELMNWEQIRIMSQSGMGIGTHGHDHSIFSRQDGAALKLQVQKSIDILESNLSTKIRSIAYPVGGYEHFNQTTKEISKELGLKLGFSYLTGTNDSKGGIDPFDVKRMSFQAGWMNLDLPLAFPKIFLEERAH